MPVNPAPPRLDDQDQPPPATQTRPNLARLGLAFAVGIGCFYLSPAMPPIWTAAALGVPAIILGFF